MEAPYKKMLIYLDGSEASMTAVMYAIMLAKANNAELHAMYVVNAKAVQDLVKAGIFIDAERQEYLADLDADADRHLRHTHKLAESKGIGLTGVKRSGSVYAHVNDYIQEQRIDLLVLGGLSGIRSRRDELMSEVDRILRVVECPVMVVKDDETIWDRFEDMIDEEGE